MRAEGSHGAVGASGEGHGGVAGLEAGVGEHVGVEEQVELSQEALLFFIVVYQEGVRAGVRAVGFPALGGSAVVDVAAVRGAEEGLAGGSDVLPCSLLGRAQGHLGVVDEESTVGLWDAEGSSRCSVTASGILPQ